MRFDRPDTPTHTNKLPRAPNCCSNEVQERRARVGGGGCVCLLVVSVGVGTPGKNTTPTDTHTFPLLKTTHAPPLGT